MVEQSLRRLRRVHGGGIGGRTRPPARDGADRFLAETYGASQLRFLLAGPGDGSHSGRATAEGADDAGGQPMGPGRYLRRSRVIQGAQSKRHSQRQSISGPGTVASRSGNWRRQHARRFAIQ